MLEIYLIILYLYFKWRLSTFNTLIYYKFPWNWLWYTPDLIQVQEVKDAVEKANIWALPYSMLIYTHLKSLLKGKTVIQIQIYGLGNHWNERCYGAGQLAVAIKLYQKLKKDFPCLSIISQDPNTYPAEIEYQKQKGIQFYNGSDFCAKRFTDIVESKTSLKIENPVMIFFAIHLPHHEFEKFLAAHWSPKLLSQIIFISNSFELTHHFAFCYARRAVEFSKFCTSIPLPLEPTPPPPKIEYSKDRKQSITFHRNDSKYFAFYNTSIHTISYENATQLCKQCS